MPRKSTRRKSEFLDVAAKIVQYDRDYRDGSLGQKITAALEKAYKKGVAESETIDTDEIEIGWVDIPRRFRSVVDHAGMIREEPIYNKYPHFGYVMHMNETYYSYFDCTNPSEDEN